MGKKILIKVVICAIICSIIAFTFDTLYPIVLKDISMDQLMNDDMGFILLQTTTKVWNFARNLFLLFTVGCFCPSIIKNIAKSKKEN